MPCYKLGIRMRMERFPKLFMASGRSGFYLKVVEEGEVGACDRFEPVGHNPGGITVRALWHLAYRERDNLEGAKAALRLTSLGPEWRHLLANRLIKAGIPFE
jgi:MOSC domain-containing protein YiiM